MKISASILSLKNKENLKENIQALSHTTTDYLHLDIMDNYFVPNKTWDVDEMKELLSGVTTPLDIHLMVQDLYKYINDFYPLNPEYLTFHFEAVDNPITFIKYIRDKGQNIKVGLSIKPTTKVEEIIPYLEFVDLVLVMSVEPGASGQEFIEETIKTINVLAFHKQQHNFEIAVDGGINEVTIKKCHNADIAVVGSYITASDNYNERIKTLKDALLVKEESKVPPTDNSELSLKVLIKFFAIFFGIIIFLTIIFAIF